MNHYKQLTSEDVNILFKKNDYGLTATITTPELIMHSLTEDNRDDYCSIFTNQEIMKTYATGNSQDISNVIRRFNNFIKRWVDNNPFSAFAISERKSNAFIGIAIIESSEEGLEPNGEKPGTAEISRALKSEYCGKGYGTEILDALSNHYAQETKLKGYLLDGYELQEIIMVTGVNNIAAQKTYEKVGGWVRDTNTKELFGHKNCVYRKVIPSTCIDNPIVSDQRIDQTIDQRIARNA